MMRILLPSPKWGLFVLGSIILLFAGCNGCDDDKDDDPSSTAKISGIVLDPYIKGARAWCDLNGNGFFDSGTDPSTTTDPRGLFTFASGQCDKKVIIIDGIDGTVHVDEEGVIIAPFTGRMKAPIGSKFVTPLTSLTQTLIDSGETPADAHRKVAKALGLPSNVADFGSLDINDKDNSSALKAAVVAQQLILSTTSAMQGVSGAPITPNAFESVTKAIADVIKTSTAPIIREDGRVDPVVVKQTLQMTVETVVTENTSYTGFDAANITNVISGAVANSVQQVAAIADKAAESESFITAAALTQTQGTGVAVIRVSMDTLKGYFDGSGDFDKDGTADIAQRTVDDVAGELVDVLDAVAIGLEEAVTTQSAGVIDDDTTKAEVESVLANVIQETVGKALEDKGLQNIAAHIVKNTAAAFVNGSTAGLGDAEINHSPKVESSTLTVRKGESKSVTLKAKDLDEDDNLTFGDASPLTSGQGTATLTDKGEFTFDATNAGIGNYTLTFDVSDGTNKTKGTIVVSVVAANFAPVAFDVKVTMRVGETLTGTFPIANFDGDDLSVKLANLKDMVVVSGDQYTINTTDVAAGLWTIIYVVDDGRGGKDSGNLIVDVTELNANNPPVAFNHTIEIEKNQEGQGTLEATDADGDTLVFTFADTTALGLSIEAAAGTFRLDTSTYSFGQYEFKFNVKDAEEASDSATLTVIVKGANNSPPIARNASLVLPEGTSKRVELFAFDVDGDALSFKDVDPAEGAATLANDGALTYNATDVSPGIYIIGFTVSDGSAEDTGNVVVEVTAENLSPIAYDTTMQVDLKGLSGLVAGTLAAIDDGALTYAITTNPQSKAVGASDGSFTFDAVTAGVGTYEIEFSAFDGELISFGSVTIRVIDSASSNAPPEAFDSRMEVMLGTVGNGVFGAIDDSDSLTFKITNNANGKASNTSGSASFTFDATGPSTAAGESTVKFLVSDSEGAIDTGVVTVTVLAPVGQNNPPVAEDGGLIVKINETAVGSFRAKDIDNDELTFSITTNPGNAAELIDIHSGEFKFTAGSTRGTFVVEFSVTDGGSILANDSTDTGKVVVTVFGPPNNPPTPAETTVQVAVDDSDFAGEIAAATDLDGDALTYSKKTDPGAGRLVVNSDGTFAYDATGGTAATPDEYTFEYTVTDGIDPVTGSVKIIVGNPPIAIDGQTFPGRIARPLTGNLQASGDTLTYSEASDPDSKVEIKPATGVFTFDTSTAGKFTFDFTVTDSIGLTDTSTVTVTVADELNNVPVTIPGLLFIPIGPKQTGVLQAVDDDSDTLTYTVTQPPSGKGVVVQIAPGDPKYEFDATGLSPGLYTFTFTAEDAFGGISEAGTVRVIVQQYMMSTDIILNGENAVSISDFETSGATIDKPLGVFSFKLEPGGLTDTSTDNPLTVKLGLSIKNDVNNDVIHVIVDAVDLVVSSTGKITAMASVGLKAYIEVSIDGTVVMTSVQNRDLNLVETTPDGAKTMLRINLGRIISRIPANNSTVKTSGWPLVDPAVTGNFTMTAVIVIKKVDDQVIPVIDVDNDPLDSEKTVTVETADGGSQTVIGNGVTGTVTLTLTP